MVDTFWLNKADFQPVAKVSSPEEMVEALKKAPKQVVTHHITPTKNDFANWARHSLQSPELASKLSQVKHDDPNALEKLIEIFSSFKKEKISAPGFPAKSAEELKGVHPQAEDLKKQTEIALSGKTSISPFNLKKKK